MIKLIKSLFKPKNKVKEYSGVADFLLHASEEEKIKMFMEAARKSNEDQLKVFNEAQLKTKAN
jgi:hypothetical protein